MSDVPAIETDALREVYGEEVAVHGLDLTVPQGEVFGFRRALREFEGFVPPADRY